jgi:hypothetical protein
MNRISVCKQAAYATWVVLDMKEGLIHKIRRIRVGRLILVVIIFELLVVGVCALIVRIREGPIIPPLTQEESLFRGHLRFAKLLEKGLPTKSWGTEIEQQRKQRAIELLTNGKLDQSVVFLDSAVAHHKIYGYMVQILFIDECASVSQVAYQGNAMDPDNPVERLTFRPRGKMYMGQRGWGRVRSKLILAQSDDNTVDIVSGLKFNEPDRLFLPKEAYQALIKGAGEMLLVDKDGNVLDRLPIEIGKFR